MIDTRTLTTLKLADRWVSIPDALAGADQYQRIAVQLYRNANTEERGKERGAARRAAHLRGRADTCQAIADELRTAARRAEMETLEMRVTA